MLDYTDYADIPTRSVNEPLVPILGSAVLTASYIRDDAKEATGMQTYVRQGVLDRLEYAGEILAARSPGCMLDVRYGYRSLAVQRSRFNSVMETLSDKLNDVERIATAHRSVAVPEVAGHPAGAAVDLLILQDGEPKDFGTPMWEFTRRSYTASPEVSGTARASRWLLADVMKQVGFAPFTGEWWHFSYGDKEWAKYYNKQDALYDQIEFTAPGATNV